MDHDKPFSELKKENICDCFSNVCD